MHYYTKSVSAVQIFNGTCKHCMLVSTVKRYQGLTFPFVFVPGTLSDLSGPGIWAGAGAETPITPGGLWPAAAEATLPVLYLFTGVTNLSSLLHLQQSSHISHASNLMQVIDSKWVSRHTTRCVLQLDACPKQSLTCDTLHQAAG